MARSQPTNDAFNTGKIKLIKSYIEDSFDLDERITPPRDNATVEKRPEKAAKSLDSTDKKANKVEKKLKKDLKKQDEETETVLSVAAGVTAEERAALGGETRKSTWRDKLFIGVMTVVIAALLCVVVYYVYLLALYYLP